MHHCDTIVSLMMQNTITSGNSDRGRTLEEKQAIVADIERRKIEDGTPFSFSARRHHHISRITWERYRAEVAEHQKAINGNGDPRSTANPRPKSSSEDSDSTSTNIVAQESSQAAAETAQEALKQESTNQKAGESHLRI